MRRLYLVRQWRPTINRRGRVWRLRTPFTRGKYSTLRWRKLDRMITDRQRANFVDAMKNLAAVVQVPVAMLQGSAPVVVVDVAATIAPIPYPAPPPFLLIRR